MLLQCGFAQRVWELAPIKFGAFNHLHAFPYFLGEAKWFVNLPPTGLSMADLYAWICWNLWTSRNQLAFCNKLFYEEYTVSKAIWDARAWQEAQSFKPKPRGSLLPHSSSTRYQSGVLCFVDAAWLRYGLDFPFQYGPSASWCLYGSTKCSLTTFSGSSGPVSSSPASERHKISKNPGVFGFSSPC